MNINKLLLEKIDNVVKLSSKFDENFKRVINFPDIKIDHEQIDLIYLLTKTYILIIAEHGSLILLINQLDEKKSLELDDLSTMSDELVEKLYDISTFNSFMNNVNDLVNNIDFQYKKIALKYPKYINKKPFTIVLVTDHVQDNKNDKYIKLIESVKTQFPENYYKIVKCETGEKKLKCDKIFGFEQTLKITSVPTLFIVNGTTITELPVDKVNDAETISNFLK